MANLDPMNPLQKEQLRRLFRVTKVLGKMLADRGFTLSEVALHSLVGKTRSFGQRADLSFLQIANLPFETFLEFRRQYNLFGNRQDFSSIYVKKADDGRILDSVVVVYLTNDPKKDVSKTHFEIVRGLIEDRVYRHFILITETKLGPDSVRQVKEISIGGYFVEIFKDVELAYDRVNHALAPIEITYVPREQVAAKAADEGIDPKKIPLILNVDPVSKWYGAKPGDLFVTEIMGTTTDTAGYYRTVRSFNEKKVAGKKPAGKK